MMWLSRNATQQRMDVLAILPSVTNWQPRNLLGAGTNSHWSEREKYSQFSVIAEEGQLLILKFVCFKRKREWEREHQLIYSMVMTKWVKAAPDTSAWSSKAHASKTPQQTAQLTSMFRCRCVPAAINSMTKSARPLMWAPDLTTEKRGSNELGFNLQ